jgi:autotransporter-associated beta strand protein
MPKISPGSRRGLRRLHTAFVERLEPRRLLSAAPGTPNSLTFHGDAARTGFNQNETVLTPTNVSANFGQVWQSPILDGHLYASPLYMDNLTIGALGSGNAGNHAGDGVVAGAGQTLGVVFAATGGGTVYAIKAFDTNGTSGVAAGTILWKTFLGSPSASIDGNNIGVLGTPIIDAKANRIYVVASVTDYLLPAADPNHGTIIFEAFALNLSNGALISGWPVVINQTVLNAAGINQNPAVGANIIAFGGAGSGAADERGGLNLSADGSILYIPFASYGSSNGGWLINMKTGITNGVSNGQTPGIVTAFSATAQPGTAPGNGGIWGAGGPAIDSSGNVFVSTGDSPGGTKQLLGSWGNSVLEFGPGQTLALTGAYTPWNYQTQDTIDTDLGGAAPVIIQMPAGSSNTPELLITGGKQGNAYLADAGNHLNNPGATPADLTMRPPVVAPNQDPSLYDTNPADPGAVRPYFSPPQVGPLNVFGPYSEVYGMTNFGRSRTTPATFVGPDGTYYAVWTGSQKITDSSTIPTAPGVVLTKVVANSGQNAYLQIAAQNTQTLSLPGASIVTANGNANPIVWVVDAGVQRLDGLTNFNNGAPTLYAYDALTMQPLWSSSYQQLDMGGKYNTLAVARGVAFVGTDRIQAFGLTTNTSIDDSVIGTGANKFQYTGAWTHTSAGTSTATMGTFQGTVSTDSVMGDTATLSFSGSQIKVYANEMSGYGTVAVSIDGGAATNVSLASSTNSPNGQGKGDVPIFTSATLGAGTHTLTLTNTANTTISLDRVEITPLSTASAALGVSVTEGNVSAVAGQPLQYTINYRNAGIMASGGTATGVNAASVVLTETVPANTSFNSANSTPGWIHGSGSTYTFSVGSLAAGDTGSVVFAVSVNSPLSPSIPTLSDTVSITDAASDSANSSRLTPIAGSTLVASRLAFGQQPSNTLSANPISPAVTVVVQDQFGNKMSGNTSTVALALNGGTFAGGSTTSVQASGGVATFSNLVINASGNYTLTATDGSLTSTVSSGFSVTSTARLAFTQQPSNSTAGTALASVNVTVEDSLGNPITGDTSFVTLTLSSGTFAGGTNTATAQAVNGVATFNSLVIDTVGNYTLAATDGSFLGATSNSFAISNAGASKLTFNQQPTSTSSGVPMAAVVVAVQDAYNNTITNDNSMVTLTLSSGVFSTGLNSVTVQASSGVATFNGLIINGAGTYSLAATDGSLNGATSSMFTISSTFTLDDSFSDPPNYTMSTTGTGVNQVNYGGTNGTTTGTGWGVQKGTTLRTAYNGTVTNSSSMNNTATVLFNGAQIKFYAGFKNSRGIAAVSIDGGPETMVDLYENDGTGDCLLAYTSPLLTPGSHTFTVRVTGTKDAASGGTIVSIDRFDIIKGTSTITWQNPADIVYGTSLGATQLNATANVPGTFSYTPAAGTVLHAGQGQTLNVNFTPTDTADYASASASVTLNVTKANPQITWPEPAGLFHGQPLTSTQLDAIADIPGTFAYSPDVGTLLPTQPDNPLSATFTPDAAHIGDYNVVMANNVIDVFPATPTITWSNPADIQLGTPLSATQLNATASFQSQPLAGTFTYNPIAGTVLSVGQNQTLGVTFNPTNTTDFVSTTASVHINVNPLTVVNTNDSGAGSLRQALLDAGNLPGTTHTITFQIPAGPQTINLATALPAMADPVVTVLDATQNVIVNSPSGTGTNAFAMITKTGAGLLSLSGKNTLTGNLQVDGGRLRLAAGTGSSPAAGIAVTVDNAATLELAGTASNLTGGKTQPVNIANTSTSTAGVEVSGTHQTAGRITGGGKLTIDAGADLTANVIIQGALVIGGASGSPATLTIAASDASGNPLAEGGGSGGAAGGGLAASAPQTANSTAAASAGPIAAASTTTSIPGLTESAASPPAVGAPMFSSPATLFLANGQGSPDPNAATSTPSGPSRPPSIGSLLQSGAAANVSWMFADEHNTIDLRSTAARAAVDDALADADLFTAIDEGLLDLLAGISQAR